MSGMEFDGSHRGHLHSILDAGAISDADVRRVGLTLHVARAVKNALDGPALRSGALLERELATSAALNERPRSEVVDGLLATFGFDAFVRAVAQVTGKTLPGIEAPQAMSNLGPMPSIAINGQAVLRDRPQLIKQIYDVLSGHDPVSDDVMTRMSAMLGLRGVSGTIALLRTDGTVVENRLLAILPALVKDDAAPAPAMLAS